MRNHTLLLSISILFAMLVIRSLKAQTCTSNLQQNSVVNLLCHGEMEAKDLEDQIRMEYSRYPGKTINHIGLSEIGKLEYMPSTTIFKDAPSVVRMQLSGFELPSWYSPFSNETKPLGIRELYYLTLSNMEGLQNWNWNDVDLYTGRSLGALSVTSSPWIRLPSQLKELYGNHVRVIQINNCGVKWLDDYSLACPQCVTINIASNQIRELRKEVFGNELQKLETLVLSANQIHRLPTDLFKNFNNIQGNFLLEVYDLLLETFDKETFEPLLNHTNLSRITISKRDENRPLDCKCSLSWMLDPRLTVNVRCFWYDEEGREYLLDLIKFLQTPTCQIK